MTQKVEARLNITLVTDTELFVWAVLYLELKPARGRIGRRLIESMAPERGLIPHEGGSRGRAKFDKTILGLSIPGILKMP